MKKRRQTVGDLSCVVTGILLAMNLPVSISPLIAAFSGVVAIVVVKQMFGGIGQNFVNPALTARIILIRFVPGEDDRLDRPDGPQLLRRGDGGDAARRPLGEGTGAALPSYLDLFLGSTGGCLGEACALALLLGSVYLRRAARHQPGDPVYLPRFGRGALACAQARPALRPAFGRPDAPARSSWRPITRRSPINFGGASCSPLAAACSQF